MAFPFKHYLIIFGFRKINFFYYIVIYFDYIKAPAIILLPLWLANEIYQLLSAGNSSIAYVAHIAGLCSGVFMALVHKRYYQDHDKDPLYAEKK